MNNIHHKSADRLVSNRILNEQGSHALLKATFNFLEKNGISSNAILDFTRKYKFGRNSSSSQQQFKRLMHAYEDVGILMSTWYTNPKFLDKSGSPLPLRISRGRHSLSALVRASNVSVGKDLALALMRCSPSIRSNQNGSLVALRRVFVLPDFEILRAAIVVQRYLDTLSRNSSARNPQTALLLERSCHTSRVDLKSITPILRDIKERGAAFVDSVDGQIESCRLKRFQQSRRKTMGEMGVLVFAWTKPIRET